MLTYRTIDRIVTIFVDDGKLKVAMGGRQIAEYGLDFVWDEVKAGLRLQRCSTKDIGMKRRSLEAQAADLIGVSIGTMLESYIEIIRENEDE